MMRVSKTLLNNALMKAGPISQMQPSQPMPPPIQSQMSTESAGIKIALNGSIGLEVTPPEENSSPSISSNTGLLISPPHQVPTPAASTEHLQGTIV
ncbi:potassium channel, sub T, member 2 [Homalodisca vitripennis]|nr:potassium channel, sub T, member 2 [Homalodisca vitripennis]